MRHCSRVVAGATSGIGRDWSAFRLDVATRTNGARVGASCGIAWYVVASSSSLFLLFLLLPPPHRCIRCFLITLVLPFPYHTHALVSHTTVPQEVRGKKRKNVTTNVFGEQIGRIHMPRQDLGTLRTNITKQDTKRRKKASAQQTKISSE